MNIILGMFKRKEKPAEADNSNSNINTDNKNYKPKDNTMYNIYNTNPAFENKSFNTQKSDLNESSDITNRKEPPTQIMKDLSYKPPSIFENMQTIRNQERMSLDNRGVESSRSLNFSSKDDNKKSFKFIKKSVVSVNDTNEENSNKLKQNYNTELNTSIDTEKIKTDINKIEAPKKSGGFGFIGKKKLENNDEKIQNENRKIEEKKIELELDSDKVVEREPLKYQESKHDDTQPEPEPETIYNEESVMNEETISQAVKNSIFSTEIFLEKLNKLETDFQNFISSHNTSYLEIIIKMHTLRQKIMLKEDILKSVKEALEILCQREIDVIECNNFEQAQILEEKIIEKQSEISTLNSELSEYKNKMINYREEEISLVKSKFTEMENFQKLFSEIKIEETNKFEQFNDVELKLIAKLTQEIKVNKEENDKKLDLIQREENEIKATEEELKEKINTESGEIIKELEDLNLKKTNLEEEIEKLRKELEEKFNCLQDINNTINEKESVIQNIKLNYKQEINFLNDKKNSFNEKYIRIKNSIDAVENNSRILEEAEKLLENKSNQANDLLNNINENLIKIKNNLDDVENDIANKENLLNKEIEIKNKLSELNLELEKINSDDRFSIEKIQNLEFANKRLGSEIMSFDIKLPNLEEEKKSYINNKNFKEAAKVSAEIKTLTENKINLGDQIKINNEEISRLKTKIEQLKNEKEQIINMTEKNKKDLVLVKYEYLNKYKSQILYLLNIISDIKLEDELKRVEEEISILEESEYMCKKSSENKSKSEFVVSENISINKYENDVEVEMEIETNKLNEEGNVDGNKEKIDDENNCNKNNDEEKNSEDKNEIYFENIKEQIDQLEKELQQLIEIEDYNKADEVNSKIEKLKNIIK